MDGNAYDPYFGRRLRYNKRIHVEHLDATYARWISIAARQMPFIHQPGTQFARNGILELKYYLSFGKRIFGS